MTEFDPPVPGTAESSAQFADEPPAFKDRKAGLIVFGILLLLIALACLGSTALQLTMSFGAGALTPEQAVDPSLFVFAALFYLMIAAITAWLGIGSIQCRRWARALLLVLSAMALVTGVITSVYMVSLFGTMSEMFRAQAVEDDVVAIVPFILGCVLAFVAFIYLVLPAAFFLFYRSPHVKATCEHYDPTPRWTDRYPAPLLAGVLLLACSALVLLAPVLGTPMPFFGALLTGVPAWIYAIVAGLLALALAAGMLRFDRRAWIGSMVFIAAAGSSAFLSFRGDGLLRMYEGMGYPQEQIEMVESFDLMRGFPTMILVSVVVMVIFFFWLGRYFGDRQAVRAADGSVSAP